LGRGHRASREQSSKKTGPLVHEGISFLIITLRRRQSI